MTVVGLIGGLGPESTIAYYRQILELAQSRWPERGAPAIVITSLDVQRVIGWMTNTQHDEAVDYLAAEIRRLASAGATFVAVTANTPHLLFDRFAAMSPVPLISIVTTARDAALARGLRRVALLGTRFTMEAPIYPSVFEAAGVSVVLPDAEERTLIHDRYIGELIPGIFRPETRALFLDIVDRMIRDDGVDGVILGGTEIPLLLTDPVRGTVPLLDTTALHVAAIVERWATSP